MKVCIEWVPRVVDEPSREPGAFWANLSVDDSLTGEARERALKTEADRLKADVAELFAGNVDFSWMRGLVTDDEIAVYEENYQTLRNGFDALVMEACK